MDKTCGLEEEGGIKLAEGSSQKWRRVCWGWGEPSWGWGMAPAHVEAEVRQGGHREQPASRKKGGGRSGV